MNKQTITSIIITLVIAGTAGFYGGLQYGTNKAKDQLPAGLGEFRRNLGDGTGNPIANRQTGNNFVNGEILSKNDSSFTVKLRDGGSKNILTAESTSISKLAAGSKEDLIIGTSVTITGKQNSDGSLTAESINIRPSLPEPALNP